MNKSYVFLADGFEEIEALTTVDLLRRGGMTVETVSIYSRAEVKGANGISVVADRLFADVDFADADWLIAPGGMPGAANLHDFSPLNALLQKHFAAGGNVAAICAAPGVVLAPLDILRGRRATCYPGFEDACRAGGADMVTKRAVTDGNLVTGNGPSSAFKFALAILAAAKGQEVARAIGEGTLFYAPESPFFF